MKSTALLIKQHDEVKALFEKLKSAPPNTPTLLGKLADNLSAHMVIEQELFYPAILNVKEDLVLEGYEEHAVIRFALKRLLKMTPADRSFEARLTTLEELIEHHVKEEEEELFPKVEKALGDFSEELGVEMKALFDRTLAMGFEKNMGRAVTTAHAPATA